MGAMPERFRFIQSLPRRKRLALFILPILLIGVVDLIRAYEHRNQPEIIIVSIIFFLVGPLLAIGWERFRYR
jgi:uncharacterized membrane protein YczE